MRPPSYKINEIFRSPQGEGARQGDDSIFVRFAGCNLKCAVTPGPRSPGGFDCDTEFVSGTRMTTDVMLDRIAALAAGSPPCEWLVLTGGEPLLQLDAHLIAALRVSGFKLALETNGTQPIPAGLDWVVVSPKVAEHALKPKEAHELRYVRHVGQGIPRPKIKAARKFLSPAFLGDQPDPEAVEWCRHLADVNEGWEVSIQMHKIWRVR